MRITEFETRREAKKTVSAVHTPAAEKKAEERTGSSSGNQKIDFGRIEDSEYMERYRGHTADVRSPLTYLGTFLGETDSKQPTDRHGEADEQRIYELFCALREGDEGKVKAVLGGELPQQRHIRVAFRALQIAPFAEMQEWWGRGAGAVRITEFETRREAARAKGARR